MMLAILAPTLGVPIPAECPQPILSYQYAASGRTPTFGCFIGRASVCTHGEDGTHVSVTPLLPDGAEQQVYDVIENLAPTSVDDYWVCDGVSEMAITVYQVYKNGDPILLYRKPPTESTSVRRASVK